MKKILEGVHAKASNYFGAYNFLGCVIGLTFVILSFLPSLLPRGWILQGVLCGVVFAIGYGLGTLLSHVIRKFKPGELKHRRKVIVRRVAYSILAVLLVIFLSLGFEWQRDIRALVGVDAENDFSVLGTALLAVLVGMFLLLVARSIRTLFRFLKRLIDRYVPPAVAYVVGLVVTTILVVGFINGFLFNMIMGALNESFSVRNGTTDSGIVQPKAAELSGSPASLIDWDTLGRQGRNFIGHAHTPKELSNFSDAPAKQPVRIYSGLESADNTEDRAELAVNDLERAGGYKRKIIVVITTTGTGWVDENGVEAIEYMYNGDAAMVAMQYSYLPSWLSFLVDQTKARDAGNELYNAVYDEVLALPEAERPKIVVFGESLGSFGGEAAFANEAAFKATSDGAVWVGPPNFNTLWGKAVSGRDEDSPEILPIYHNGETVRFAARPADLKQPEKPWDNPKITYLQNPSDPIVWWSPKLLLQKPDWLSEPHGVDVSPAVTWIPIISFFQVSGDMVFSTGVPDGHGHKYGDLPTDAWSYVAPPEGWTQQKTEALKAELRK